jgi:hypothetical protein
MTRRTGIPEDQLVAYVAGRRTGKSRIAAQMMKDVFVFHDPPWEKYVVPNGKRCTSILTGEILVGECYKRERWSPSHSTEWVQEYASEDDMIQMRLDGTV